MPPLASPLPDMKCMSTSYPRVTSKRYRKKKKKAVSFREEKNEIFEIVHINELVNEIDISKIWYSRAEYVQISKHCYETVQHEIERMIEQDKPQQQMHNDGEDWCIRGLELKLESSLARQYHDFRAHRRRCQQISVEVVLDEDELQRSEGIYDDELLADIYFDYSRYCQFESERIGWKDYKEVFRLWEK